VCTVSIFWGFSQWELVRFYPLSFEAAGFAQWLVLAKEMVGYLVGNEEKAGAIVKLVD
jgi:hypothetical protein